LMFICFQIYVKNASIFRRPSCIMVEFATLIKCNSIAKNTRIDCVPTVLNYYQSQ
jgi:hypothetical protein